MAIGTSSSSANAICKGMTVMAHGGRLEGKVAFITGAGAGIARAAAKNFAKEGAKVVIAEINEETGKACENEVLAASNIARFIKTDVTNEESVKRAISEAVEVFGKLDILYNSAGGSIQADTIATDVDMSVWNHTISLDLLGTFLCVRHGIPAIIEAGGGAVVNTASNAALMGFTPRHVYTAAKGGIVSLTRALASDYGKYNIRVNAIAPGVTWSDRTKSYFESSPKLAAEWAPRFEAHPFARGQPDDMANVALFLASEEARMITGATIPADGGMNAF